MNTTETELVTDFWSNHDGFTDEKNFFCFPPIRTHLSDLIFNEKDASRKDWCQYWTIEKFLKDIIPCETLLSICCGFGEIERQLSKLNAAKKIIGIDIAPGAVEVAKKRALEDNCQNIEYYVADLQKENLPENTYDIIWANGALHHIKDLEYLIPMLYKALKPNGFLISNEYVGPNYQQISNRHEELVNAAIHFLPDELKENFKEEYQNAISIKSKGYYFSKYLLATFINKVHIGMVWKKPSLSFFLKHDPSEGVNSEIIVPTLKKHFENVEVKFYNGSIVFFALGPRFYNNFNLNNPSHRSILNLLFEIEDTLVEVGEIPNIYAHIICQKSKIVQ